jgi:hypothetical protein
LSSFLYNYPSKVDFTRTNFITFFLDSIAILKAHPGAMEAHPGAVEAHPGAVEAHPHCKKSKNYMPHENASGHK